MRPAKAMQSPPNGTLVDHEIIFIEKHVHKLVKVRHRAFVKVIEELLLIKLTKDSRTSAWIVIWNEDSTVLDPTRSHSLHSP